MIFFHRRNKEVRRNDAMRDGREIQPEEEPEYENERDERDNVERRPESQSSEPDQNYIIGNRIN